MSRTRRSPKRHAGMFELIESLVSARTTIAMADFADSPEYEQLLARVSERTLEHDPVRLQDDAFRRLCTALEGSKHEPLIHQLEDLIDERVIVEREASFRLGRRVGMELGE